MVQDRAVLPPLPADAVLVHIGMHKTGTTAIQSVLAARRETLAGCGAVYPGTREAHHLEARSLTQADVGQGGADKAPPPRVWSDLATEIAREPRRVVISSEFFSGARGDEPARLVTDLGRDRVHILLGVRNLTLTAVSTWQQTLKQGRVSDIERWARANIPRDGKPGTDLLFWEHWDLGAMARRWADAAGPDRVTVVVLDSTDRVMLPATFEQLLDLGPGELSGQQPRTANRGMTAAEAELVRQVNLSLRGELPWEEYRRIVRQGVIRSMVEARAPGPDEPRPMLPAWAQEATQAAGRRAAEEVAATGVRVVGDLASLHAEVAPPVGSGRVEELPVDVGVHAIVGAVQADPRNSAAGAGRLDDVPAGELVRVLARRLRRRAARTARRIRS
jgi:hypothetical protein